MKNLRWPPGTKKEFNKLPEDVRDELGTTLNFVQNEKTKNHPKIKALQGIDSGVFQISEKYKKDSYRLVYKSSEDFIYILHSFKKKSKSGSKTPERNIDKIEKRLKFVNNEITEEKKNDKNR